MAYTKHNWLQRLGTGLNKFKDTISGSVFALVNQPDTVTQAGTPLRADWLNEMEQGIFEAHNIADAAKLKADAALPASSYSATDVLAKLKTVHGVGSGINADLLDGLEGLAYAKNYNTANGANIIASLAHVFNLMPRVCMVGGHISQDNGAANGYMGFRTASPYGAWISPTYNGTAFLTWNSNGTWRQKEFAFTDNILYGSTVPAYLYPGQIFVKI